MPSSTQPPPAKSVSRRAVSRRAVSRRAVSRRAVSRRAVSRRAVSRRAVSRRAVSRRAGPPRSATWPVGAVVGGVLTVVAGTFSPWLASGDTTRNVYGAAGVGERLLGLNRGVALAVEAIPFLGFIYAVGALLWALGRRRGAAAAVGLTSAVVAVAGIAALRAPQSGSVHIVRTGPVVTLVGALIILSAMIVPLGVVCVQRRSSPRDRRHIRARAKDAS